MRLEHITIINKTHEGLSEFNNPYAKLTLGRTYSFTKVIQRVYKQVLIKKNAFRIIFE